MIQNTQSGTLTSAAIQKIDLLAGEEYSLVVGLDGDNFNAFTVTPYLSNGINAGLAAEGTLTLAAQPTAGDTMRIGAITYTFIAIGETPTANQNQIVIGTNLAATQAAVVDAINGTEPNAYASNRTNPLVSAANFAANAAVLTARQNGADGNDIVTTETFTNVGNLFDAATLGTTTAGTDSYTGKIALPQINSADSNGSPLTFAAEGMIGFEAILPCLLLVPSGAVTSVNYTVTRRGGQKKYA